MVTVADDGWGGATLCICNFKRNANELTEHHSFNMLFFFLSSVNLSVNVDSLLFFDVVQTLF